MVGEAEVSATRGGVRGNPGDGRPVAASVRKASAFGSVRAAG